MQTNDSGTSQRKSGSTISDINRKTGRNMPQAIATAVVLIALLVAVMLIRIDLLMWVIVVFMLLALWELRVDFAVIDLHIPVVALWLCCAATLIATFYAPMHVTTSSLCIAVSVVFVAIAATHRHGMNVFLSRQVAGKDKQERTKNVQESSPGGNTCAPCESDGKGTASSLVRDSSVMRNVAVSVFVVLYIAAFASCIILPLTFGRHPVAHAIMVIFLPALSDTGGLLVGAWLGKHKLSPRISPKKSYEGLAGSMVFAAVGALVVFLVTYRQYWSDLWWVPIVIGMVVGFVGTFGDLCASMIKRDIGIKDMGHLLKGHGGVMDRVDSILLCAPFFTLILWLLGL